MSFSESNERMSFVAIQRPTGAHVIVLRIKRKKKNLITNNKK